MPPRPEPSLGAPAEGTYWNLLESGRSLLPEIITKCLSLNDLQLTIFLSFLSLLHLFYLFYPPPTPIFFPLMARRRSGATTRLLLTPDSRHTRDLLEGPRLDKLSNLMHAHIIDHG